MARAIVGISHFCLALICAISLFPRPVDAEELRYGRLNPFCPFTCNFEESGQYGVVIDIFRAVTAMNGMTYRDVEVPSKRKFTALDSDFSNVTTVWSTNKKAIASVVPADEVRGSIPRVPAIFSIGYTPYMTVVLSIISV
jgi:hypothetical protein